jgi:hypothetical protein
VGTLSPDNESAKSMTATCTDGRKVIGGGFELSAVSDPNVLVLSSAPTSDTVWTVTANSMTSGGGVDRSYALRAYAICATVAP